MKEQAFTILLMLAIGYLIGLMVIELRNRGAKKGYTGHERRRTRKVIELEPLGETILHETQEMLDKEKLATRDGLKFIMRMMQELYVSDMRRTLKVNELVEQFEIIHNKTLISWIEARPKVALFLSLIAMALVVDEIRQPILRYALSQVGVHLP